MQNAMPTTRLFFALTAYWELTTDYCPPGCVHRWTFAGISSKNCNFLQLFGPLGAASRRQRSIRKPCHARQIRPDTRCPGRSRSLVAGPLGNCNIDFRLLFTRSGAVLSSQWSVVSEPWKTTCARITRPGLVQRQGMKGDKSWVAGVESRAPGRAPRAARPRTWGRRPSVADPSHPEMLPAFEPGPKSCLPWRSRGVGRSPCG